METSGEEEQVQKVGLDEIGRRSKKQKAMIKTGMLEIVILGSIKCFLCSVEIRGALIVVGLSPIIKKPDLPISADAGLVFI